MREEFRHLQEAIEHAIRNLKLDPETFRKEILDDLDRATLSFSTCIDSIKERLRTRDYEEALTDLERMNPRGT